MLLANWGIGLEVLRSLHGDARLEVVQVITRCETALGDQWASVVRRKARELEIPVLGEEETDFETMAGLIRDLDVQLMVVHAYPRRLPQEIFETPGLGSVNIHASLLPRHRGPAPTYWVLKNRERQTGLTAHYIDHGLDTGDIIHQCRIPVHAGDPLEDVIERLKKVVPELVAATIDRVLAPDFIPQPQTGGGSYAPRPQR
jgi:methionyl-tRNA formyltransferase